MRLLQLFLLGLRESGHDDDYLDMSDYQDPVLPAVAVVLGHAVITGRGQAHGCCQRPGRRTSLEEK